MGAESTHSCLSAGEMTDMSDTYEGHYSGDFMDEQAAD